MFDFLKRFVLAWKLARNPDALKVLWTEVKTRETEQQIRSTACENARVAMSELIPEDRHAHRKDLDVTVLIECEEPTPEQVAQILEESRIENKTLTKPELPGNPDFNVVDPLGILSVWKEQRRRMDEHSKKFPEAIRQSFD